MLNQALQQMARDDVDGALSILEYAAMRGTRAKPTVAELNEVLTKLRNASALLRTADIKRQAAALKPQD